MSSRESMTRSWNAKRTKRREKKKNREMKKRRDLTMNSPRRQTGS